MKNCIEKSGNTREDIIAELDVLRELVMNYSAFMYRTQYGLLEVNRRFGGTCRFRLQF